MKKFGPKVFGKGVRGKNLSSERFSPDNTYEAVIRASLLKKGGLRMGDLIAIYSLINNM